MGCIVSFKYKSKNFEDIEWYSEKIDHRLKNIYLIKSKNPDNENFIAKEISLKLKKTLTQKKNKYKKAFEKTPEFFLKIIGFEEKIKIIDCSEKRSKKHFKRNFVKIEIFEKSLADDINVRALKNRIYNNYEIWNLIYFSIYIFSILEENKLEIGKIEIFNFLINKKKFIYFCPNLFFYNKDCDYNENFIFEQFQKKKKELILVFFSVINNIYNIKEREDLKNLSYENLIDFLLRESDRKIHDQKLMGFLNDVFISNIYGFCCFKDVRKYCCEIFNGFKVRFFDGKYVKMFKNE